MSLEEKISVKVLGSMIGYATEQLAIHDEGFKNKLKGLNEVIQWKIGDDIAYYTEIKDESIKANDGISPNPTITFEIEDVSKALSLLTGKIDVAGIAGDMKISGDAAKIQQLGFILETVAEYMEGLRGG
ncbi:MAG: SCP2 sterol-binding domain-containing protein [Candidatus Hodarchaeota archaeon]